MLTILNKIVRGGRREDEEERRKDVQTKYSTIQRMEKTRQVKSKAKVSSIHPSSFIHYELQDGNWKKEWERVRVDMTKIYIEKKKNQDSMSIFPGVPSFLRSVRHET